MSEFLIPAAVDTGSAIETTVLLELRDGHLIVMVVAGNPARPLASASADLGAPDAMKQAAFEQVLTELTADVLRRVAP